PLIISCGIAEGFWTNRWTSSGEIQAAVLKLEQVPMTLGPWQAQARELDADQIRAAQLSGYLSREYVHRSTRKSISILLVCGRAGPVAVHPPDACYRGAGYEPTAAYVRQAIVCEALNSPAEFFTAIFGKEESVVPDLLRIYWSWNASGTWQAPDNPR